MSTDSTAFTSQIAHSVQDVRFNPIRQEGFNYKISDDDLFHIPIVITNAGASSFSDELVAFTINTQGLASAAPSLSDVRLYDTDARTLIPFCLQGTKFTTATTIFFRLTLAANTSKTFYVGYGSRGSVSLSDSTILPAGYRKDKSVHIYASDVRYPTTKTIVNNEKICSVRNHANKFNSPATFFGNASDYRLQTGMLSGHQSIRRNSGAMTTAPAHNYPKSRRSDSIAIFTVINPTSNANAGRVFTNQDFGDYVVYPYWNPGTSSNRFIISNDGAVTGIATGVVPSVNQISSAHWKKNTTNGMRTYRNGSLVDQRNSANVNLPAAPRFGFLSSQDSGFSEWFGGDFYELIVYDDAMLADADRNDVYTYLNAKYRIYGKQTQLTHTVGSAITKTSQTSYSRRYIFDNSFKAARTNAILSITIDTSALVTASKITSNIESLRVYNRAGEPLDFFSLYPNTTSSKIFVRCPHINADEKYEVIVTYANAAIGSVEDENNVIPALVRNNTNFWIRGYRQTADRSVLVDSSPFGNNATQANPTNQSSLGRFITLGYLNQMAVVRFFSATPNWYSRAGGLAGYNPNESTMFVVGYGRDGRVGGIVFHPFESLITFNGNTNDVIFPDAFGRLMHARNNFNPFYTVWPAVEPTQNIEQALGVTFTNTVSNAVASYRLETTGYSKSQIGNGIGYNSYHNEDLWIGIRNYLAQGSNADISEIIILNKHISDAEARLVMEYLNDIYHLDKSVVIPYEEMPEQVIIGGVPSIFDSYAQVSSYDYSIGDTNALGEILSGESTIVVNNIMEDTFVGVQNDYDWSESELSEEQKTFMQYERKLTITDTPIVDRVRIGYYKKGGNKADLATNSIPNLTSPYRISYDDNDLISFRLHVEDVAKIDLDASKIRFYNTNIISYSAVKWWENTSNTDIILGANDPFGSEKASTIDITGNVAANTEFLVFASKFGQHPEPLDSFNGIHTASVYIKSTKRIVIAAWGSGYANYIQSSATSGSGEWERIQVTTTATGYEYESVGLRSLDAMTSSDEVVVFAPTLTQGTLYSNIAGSCDYEAVLSDSIISVVDGNNEVKIKKSSFVGGGAWSEVDWMELELVAPAGETQDIAYSYFRVEKNMLELPQLQQGAGVQLARTVSTDDWQTQYTSQTSLGLVRQSYVNTQDDAKVKMGDILSAIDNDLRFSDLPTFDETIIFDYSARFATGDTHLNPADFLITILNMIFPRNLISTTIYYIDENTFTFDGVTYNAQYPHTRFYSIKPTDFVKETIQNILSGLFASLRYDTKTNQIRIRRAPEYLYQLNPVFPTINIDNVISYRSVTSTDAEIYNTLKLEAYISTLNNKYTTVVDTGYLGGFGDQSFEIPPTQAGRFSLFIPIETFNISLEYTPSFRDILIDGFNVTTEAGNGATMNNTNVFIIDARQVEDKILLVCENLNTAPRYLFNISISGYMQSHLPNSAYASQYAVGGSMADLNALFRDNPQINKVSVQKYGTREYKADYRFLTFGTVFYNDPAIGPRSTSLQPRWWFGTGDNYALFNDISSYVSATIIPPDGLMVNDRIKMKDENSREIIGIIVRMEQSDSDRLSILVKVLEYV